MNQKKFNFSYGELLQRGDRVVVLVERDSVQFQSVGYEQEFVDELSDKLDYFRQLQPDEYWSGLKTIKTNEKNEARSELMYLLSELKFRARLALGEDTVNYKSFRFANMEKADENKLIFYGNHVVKMAGNMLEELAPRRVDDTTLTEIGTAIGKLDDTIDEQKNSVSVREEKTFERREKANELYNLIAEASEVGKRVWDGKNHAFYDDYVIYGSQSSINEDEEPVDENTDLEEEAEA